MRPVPSVLIRLGSGAFPFSSSAAVLVRSIPGTSQSCCCRRELSVFAVGAERYWRKQTRTQQNATSRRSLSRYSANRIMTGVDTFCIADYDCVGFDLDNTLLRYQVGNVIELEYDIMSRFLVEQRGYSGKYLLQPPDLDFLQKGLVIDFQRGNILKLSADGTIHQATHGTKKMAEAEIIAYYGDEKKWEVTNEYCQNMLVAWNGPLSEKIRTVLDYFDICSTMIFGRIIDTLDEEAHERIGHYNVWPDILDSLVFMYSREHFGQNIGGYFEALKQNPDKYLQKTSPKLISWLRELKKSKTTFLVTGSHIDFANFSASYALGPDWPELFDVIVGFAKKPGFFTGAKPFVMLDGSTEMEPVTPAQLERHHVYSQGNWRDLTILLQRLSHKENPRYLYVGDNLIQDVYTPSKYTKADTIAIVEEMAAEGMKDHPHSHPDARYLQSQFWGSYFLAGPNRQYEESSLWAHVIKRYARICVPSMDEVAQYPVDHSFNSFTEGVACADGYYPAEPMKLVI
ncbi:5'-nucleotidase domain-containing protein 1-like [Uranotaenia lowii]|uniref:5'-nucleotidase domain-containing protein 1-like n=1 Tax=Uranotaenia lowii TaxID=190385 RepID=UPI00247A20ED|nr:5'-nucleotidase domain-containing protein 1-like [Uranotaenia lowii]XP_055607131.1 5'-nucleotidase domain-containing protein 1-like [Uranotaenia lowii]XP_055607132.1 5'-nucleotidase domain-containing protein 1-like [Uranotaenia lowii]XP_055607133.1 5'-nucleotidase domain-containing protein 1-like [Uranotaenia lowii]